MKCQSGRSHTGTVAKEIEDCQVSPPKRWTVDSPEGIGHDDCSLKNNSSSTSRCDRTFNRLRWQRTVRASLRSPPVSTEASFSSRTPVFGIVGGIGSGKSAVTRGLAEFLQVRVIDADRIGHEVLTLPKIKQQIFHTFGSDVFVADAPSGEIDRGQLAKRVFGTDTGHNKATGHNEALTQLEAIVHPEIRRQMTDQIQQAQAENQVVLVDAAVMLEAGWKDLCDRLIFIDVPFETRLRRVVENRGWDEAELRRREASQLPLETKKQAADFVVDNSQTLQDSVSQFCRIIQSLTMA